MESDTEVVMKNVEELLIRARMAREMLEQTTETQDKVRGLLNETDWEDIAEAPDLDPEETDVDKINAELNRLNKKLEELGLEIEIADEPAAKASESQEQAQDEIHHDEQLEDTLHKPPMRRTTLEKKGGMVLKKISPLYEGKSFQYLWSLEADELDLLDEVECVQFVRDDSGKSCKVRPERIKAVLEKSQTDGKGNFDFMLLNDRQNDLALPGKASYNPWNFIRVTWGYGR